MAPRQENIPPDGSLSVIGAGMKITGDIETTGVVKIDGTIEGSIRAAKQVLLGRTGAIHGDVNAEETKAGSLTHCCAALGEHSLVRCLRAEASRSH